MPRKSAYDVVTREQDTLHISSSFIQQTSVEHATVLYQLVQAHENHPEQKWIARSLDFLASTCNHYVTKEDVEKIVDDLRFWGYFQTWEEKKRLYFKLGKTETGSGQK